MGSDWIGQDHAGATTSTPLRDRRGAPPLLEVRQGPRQVERAYLPLLWSSATHGETHARDYTAHYQETGKYLDEGRFVLHIGDLGAEPKEAQYYGSRSSVIASIICRRSDQHGERLSRPMVITSNYPPDALSGPNLYDDRTASRIQGDCVIVHLSSTDHRLASAQPRS